ncbi:MAG: helix-turn-helix transcriptional regulator [Clostridia bacterium]|nr:helix-turn-helix transcriptional regulator [Clostridia bacterium]
MNIGNKIKELRHGRGVTQEQLADSIGVTFQAVSKWECGISLPDITIAPSLAAYFGVTLDELFDFNLREADSEIEKICSEAYKYRESDPARGRRILEEGLAKYPSSDILLNNLLYVINYSENPDETIALASKLATKTVMPDVKYDALRFLAYAYKAKGDLVSAQAAVEQIPEIYFTKLTEVAYLLEGKPMFDAAEKQKWISFENLVQMIFKTAEYYEFVGENSRAIREIDRAMSLIEVMENENFDSYAEFFRKETERIKKIL